MKQSIKSIVAAIHKGDDDGLIDKSEITSPDALIDAIEEINDSEEASVEVPSMDEATEVFTAFLESLPPSSYAIQARSMQSAIHNLLLYSSKEVAQHYHQKLSNASDEEMNVVEKEAVENAIETIEINFRDVNGDSFYLADDRKVHIINPDQAHDVYGI